jgi:hypothetical protein
VRYTAAIQGSDAAAVLPQIDSNNRNGHRSLLFSACQGDATRAVAAGTGHSINFAEAVAEEAERHPGAVIETFATDEHRIGLKPILRRVWAPRGHRPFARGLPSRRFQGPRDEGSGSRQH